MGVSQDKRPCFFNKYIVTKQGRGRGRERREGREGKRQGMGVAEKGRERQGDRETGMEEKPVY